MNMHTEPTSAGPVVPSSAISSICAARTSALAMMAEAAAGLDAAYGKASEAEATLKRAVGGGVSASPGYGDKAYEALFRGRYDAQASLASYRKALDVGIWTYLIDVSGMSTMMDKTAKDELRQSFTGDVPEATEENVRATLTSLIGDSQLIFARGLAKAFSKLDRRFKSHDAFKIGSRIILDRCFSEYGGGWNYYQRHDDTIADVERVFAVLDGQAPAPGELREAVDVSRRKYGPQQSECETRYFKIRGFKNGNAHLWMMRDDLVTKANKVLADYYGAALGDAAEASARPEDYVGTAVTTVRDLQFYGTPAAVVDEVLRHAYAKSGLRVLEPSAGEGAIVAPLLAKGMLVDAVEIHPSRAIKLREMQAPYGQLRVFNANFLTFKAAPTYDLVVMNPPFSGTHWMDHVRKAFDLLAPGGQLLAILPASAEVNETAKHLAFRRWAEKVNSDRYGRLFRDLPPESFAETGTRVQTVILELRKGRV